jgi:hypothetical protein
MSDVHVGGLRRELSIAYSNDRAFLAGDAIAPLCPVNKSTDLYPEFSRADWMRIQMELGTDEDPAPRMSFGVSTSTYACKKYHGKAFLSDEKRTEADDEFELDKAYIEFVTDQALLKREKVIADAYWTTSVWGTDYTPSTKWSSSSSDPFGELRTGCRTIQTAIGRWPTDLVLGSDVADTLADHADVLDRIKGGAKPSDPANMRLEHLASALGLQRVTVAEATYNTAGAGATVSMSQLFDPHDALLIYRPAKPMKFTPSGAYTFCWTPFDSVQGESVAIKTWRTDDPEGEYFRGALHVDPKITASAAGYFFDEATA